MSDAATTPESAPPSLRIDLREPWLAALLAWAWPGAGHLYQGRYGKGILYMVCILSTWCFGIAMAYGAEQANVVYVSFGRGQDEFRWHYLLQAGVGIPASPALVQWFLNSNNNDKGLPLLGKFMASPGKVDTDREDKLAIWHNAAGLRYDLGTLYTVVAGLLNILVIYDAYAGPVIAQPDDKSKRKKKPDAE